MDVWVLDTQTEILEHIEIQAALPGHPSSVHLPWCPMGTISDQKYLVAQGQRGVEPGRTSVPFRTFEHISESPLETQKHGETY